MHKRGCAGGVGGWCRIYRCVGGVGKGFGVGRRGWGLGGVGGIGGVWGVWYVRWVFSFGFLGFSPPLIYVEEGGIRDRKALMGGF